LPGIPLAIMFPEKQVDLLDSNSKKIRFLTQAKTELGLQNTQVIHGRVERYQPEELYDGVVSRAFASMNDMLHWTNHLLKEGGAWWAMKGQEAFEDLTSLPGEVRVQEVIKLRFQG